MAIIYQTPDFNSANIRVTTVSDPEASDLDVYLVDSRSKAVGDALWFIEKDPDDAISVYFSSAGVAQLKIHFVDTSTEAGWKRRHRLEGSLGTKDCNNE